MSLGARFVLGVVVATAIALTGLRARALTRGGALGAILLGAVVFGFGGLAPAAALIAFFASGSILSRLARRPGAIVAAKGAQRDAVQVLANGGVAAVFAVGFYAASRLGSPANSWLLATIAALAAASADTWSAEIGIRFGRAPRLLINMRCVRPGVSGGVTVVGLTASLGGGAIVGAAAAPFSAALSVGGWIGFATLIGFIGSLVDSLLGATIQGVWYCDACKEPCESSRHACGGHARHVRGLRFIDNDAVNALATLIAATLALMVAQM